VSAEGSARGANSTSPERSIEALRRKAEEPSRSLGTVAVLALFVLGVVAGVTVGQATRTRPPVSPFPGLPLTSEPVIGAQVAEAIANDDARVLAHSVDGQMLGALGQSLEPIVNVSEVRFVGAVEKSGDTLSAYVVQGRDLQGTQLLVGYVLRVRGDKVIGVN
jgi:hypothetical protein